ncbi:MAG: isoaspartyl peptidase/L-asparaginase [Myxococcales bacterium]|nr:isoaspartyl peptidase/L-asparaginase [Myxococcales bacterium]
MRPCDLVAALALIVACTQGSSADEAASAAARGAAPARPQALASTTTNNADVIRTIADPAADPATDPATATPLPALPTRAGALARGPLVVTHGGAGSPPALADGPQAAAAAALARLAAGDAAVDAAIAGVIVLEDDPRFNAGTGANIRLDGRTIQMDASLMGGDGRFAAVAAIERVRNPIRAARLVLDSPHVLLAGEGATRFAHRLGLADEIPRSDEAEAKYHQRMKALGEAVGRGEAAIDWRAYWNFPGEMPPEMVAWREGGDTVGAVVRDREGRFAAALSTGGTSVTLYGRVGDVPIYGAGLFAGEAGAVACTGEGEEIIRQGLARRVYDAIVGGASAERAVAEAAAAFPKDQAVGLIAVDRAGWGVASNLEMAHGIAASTATATDP